MRPPAAVGVIILRTLSGLSGLPPSCLLSFAPCLNTRDVFACGSVPKLEGSGLWAGKGVSWWRAQMTRCVPAARYYVAATA